jgi:hypothetical protein
LWHQIRPQDHQDQEGNGGNLLTITIRRPWQQIGPQDHEGNGGNLLIITTRRPWHQIGPQDHQDQEGDGQ